jgi:hypothetical protein
MNSRFEVRRFVPQDFSILIARSEQKAEQKALVEGDAEAKAIIAKSSMAVTFCSSDNKLYALGGLSEVQGVIERVGWALIGQDVPPSVLKAIVKWAKEFIDNADFPIHVTVKKEFEQARRTVRFLGFQRHQSLPKMFNDEDYELWIWEPKK